MLQRSCVLEYAPVANTATADALSHSLTNVQKRSVSAFTQSIPAFPLHNVSMKRWPARGAVLRLQSEGSLYCPLQLALYQLGVAGIQLVCQAVQPCQECLYSITAKVRDCRESAKGMQIEAHMPDE